MLVKSSCAKIFFLLISIFHFSNVIAGSCEGKGSVIVYGNGMFNTIKDAWLSSDSLRSAIGQSKSPINQSYDIAYKRSEPILEQLVNMVAQKGVTEFEKYWMWVNSLEAPPDWFKAEVESRTKGIFSRGMNGPRPGPWTA
jgi:hypothetical protein